MSTAAETTTGKRARMPVYRRKRRRIYGGIVLAVVIVAALVTWAVTRGGGAAEPNFTISTSTGNVADADSIIATDKSLANTIPAKLHFVPFEAGVTAVAEMRSGTVQSISGVGNPPAVGGIGTGTGIDVVMAQSFDADGLIVPRSITSASQLAGKSVGVLNGSSEDYELRGWLGQQHLLGSVRIVPFGSEQAASAAYLAGAVSAAYVYGGPEAALTARGGHPLINAEQIAKLGTPGIDVVAVSDNLVRNNPALVQKYVCAEVQATRLFTGPQGNAYLARSAGFQGVPANLIKAATQAYPFIPLSQQLYWLGSTRNDTTSPIVRAYGQTGQFLVGQGRLPSVPSAAQLAAHVDPTFVKKALSGAC
jgi:taurine transport system substrate-binding protein